MNSRDYYLSLQNAIHIAPHVLRSHVRFEEIDGNECYTLAFVGTVPLEANNEEEGSHLHQPHRWFFAVAKGGET